MAGAATAITQPAMNNMYREMARYRRARQAYVNAHRKYNQALFRAEGGEQALADKVDFACFHLCSGCGYLADVPSAGCPSCGATSWLDLSSMTVAEQMREMEQSDRHLIPGSVKIAVFVGVSILFIVSLLVYALVIGARDQGFGWYSFTFFVVSLALYWVFRRRAAKLYFRLHPRPMPIRWRIPVIPRGAKKERKGIPTTVRGETSTVAPFSGMPCLGYKISVMFDVHGDARPPEWVLAEMAAVDLSVAGTTVAGSNVLVETPLNPISEEDLSTASFDIDRFLRERGLFLSEGSFRFFESRIENGASVTAHRYQNCDIVSLSA